MALICVHYSFSSHPVPESEYSIFDPNAKKFFIFVDYLKTLQGIPLPPLIHFLYFLSQYFHSFVFVLKLALLSNLCQFGHLFYQFLINHHMSIQVLSHDLILQKINLSILECKYLSEELSHVFLVFSVK
jgi:hypothetical protein